MVRTDSRRERRTRVLAAGVLACGALGLAAPAYADHPGSASGMGANCPMGSDGSGSAGAGPSPMNQSSGSGPLSMAGRSSGLSTGRSGGATRAPVAQAAPVAQPAAVPAQAATGAADQPAAATQGAGVLAAVRPDPAAVERARQARVRAEARRREARRAATIAFARSQALRARTAAAERWHAPAAGSTLPAEPAAAPAAATTEARDVMPLALMALALLALAGLGAAGLRLRRRGTGGAPAIRVETPLLPPLADPASVEAALQEMLAEERAARLLDRGEVLSRD